LVTTCSLPNDRLPCYASCPELVEARMPATQQSTQVPTSRPCSKKVTQEAGGWRCASGHLCAQPVYRYIARMQVMDHTDSMEVNMFDEQGKKFFGVDADTYAQAFETEQVDDINSRALWRKVSVRMTSKKEVWQETERMKVQLEDAHDLDWVKDGKLLLSQIKGSLASNV